jgi:hypothetical protein
MFGVIRSAVLRQATLQGDYPASDLVMQSDLAIRGRFIRVRGEFFYRRVHVRSTQNLGAVALAQFYDPKRTTAFQARQFRMLFELMRVVQHAHVSAREKQRMWYALAQRAFWSRGSLAHELGTLLTKWFVPAARRSASEDGTEPRKRGSFPETEGT